MHAHDRTLISRLGFADPDKQDPTHDLICQYAGSRAARCRIANLASGDRIGTREIRGTLREEGEVFNYRGTQTGKGVRATARYEIPIGKGTGQYKTTVGFLDVVIDAEISVLDRGQKQPRGNPDSGWVDYEREHPIRFQVVVEAKVEPIGAGEILRQINLYREYENQQVAGLPTYWVVIAAFTPPPRDIAVLKQSGIIFMGLGESFDEWVAKQKEVAADPSLTPAIVTI